MKRAFSLFLVFILCATFGSLAYAATPQENIVSQQIQQMDDSSYVIITLRESLVNARANPYTQNGSKDYTYVLNGTVQWTFTVYGIFTVDPGVSSVCTDSAYGFQASVGGWTLSSADSSHSGSTATAWGTVTGPKTVYPRVSVSCDVNGNLF